MSNQVRPGIDASVVESPIVRGRDAQNPGQVPGNLQITTGRNSIDDTTGIITIWNRTDEAGAQLFDLRSGSDFNTAVRIQYIVGNGDPNGSVPATSGSMFISQSPPLLWQNQDGDTEWKVISDDLGNENLEETLAIGNWTGALPIIVSAGSWIQAEDSDTGAGSELLFRGGHATGAVGNGGRVHVLSGTSAGGNSGDVRLETAGATGGGAAGIIEILGGSAQSAPAGHLVFEGGTSGTGIGGSASLRGGGTNSGSQAGGASVIAGSTSGGGAGGNVRLEAGHAVVPPAPGLAVVFPNQGGSVFVNAGRSGASRPGGSITLEAGPGGAGGGQGGSIIFNPGAGGGGGAAGQVIANGVFRADNIKRGNGDPNVLGIPGNEGDVFQRTTGGIGELWLNRNGLPDGWERLVFGSGGFIEAFTRVHYGYWSPSGSTEVAGTDPEKIDAVGLFTNARIITAGAQADLDIPEFDRALLLSVNAGVGNHVTLDTHFDTGVQRRHRPYAVFKFDLSTGNLGYRVFIGLANPSGVQMGVNDAPNGQYIGIQKPAGNSSWRFITRNAGIDAATTIPTSDTQNSPTYLVIDAADWEDGVGGPVVVSLLDRKLQLLSSHAFSGPNVPTASLRPVFVIHSNGDSGGVRMYHSALVTESNLIKELGAGGGGGGVPTLESVLAVGNESGDNDIILTDHDMNHGGQLLGENDPSNNTPHGGRLTILSGSTTDPAGDGGRLLLASGGPAAASAGRSGNAIFASGDVLDALNAGGTGNVIVGTGTSAGSGTSGNLALSTGTGLGGGGTGTIQAITGNAFGGDSGSVQIITGTASSGTAGNIEFAVGAAQTAGAIFMNIGDASTGPGGSITFTAGNATAGVEVGGDIILNPGVGSGGAADGAVVINGKLTVTGLIDPTGLVLTGQLSVPVFPGEGDGVLWVDSTGAASILKYTDDQGNTVSFGADGAVPLFQVLTAGNSTGGQTITAGDMPENGNTLVLEGGNSLSDNGDGGDVVVSGGTPDGSGDGGTITLNGGSADSGDGGSIILVPGSSNTGENGKVIIHGELALDEGSFQMSDSEGGNTFQVVTQDPFVFSEPDDGVVFQVQEGTLFVAVSGENTMSATDSDDGNSFTITGGNALATDGDGGDVVLKAGEGGEFGVGGDLLFQPAEGGAIINQGPLVLKDTEHDLEVSGGDVILHAQGGQVYFTTESGELNVGPRTSFSVKESGAVGDGVTDDTLTIQAFLDNAEPGSNLFFPSGDYVVTQTLSWSGKALTLTFENGAALVEGTPLTTPILQAENCDGSFLYDVQIKGIETQAAFDYSESDRVGIQIETSSRVTVKNARVENKSYGVRLLACQKCNVLSPQIRGFLDFWEAQSNNHAGVVVSAGSDNIVSGGSIANVGVGVLGILTTRRLGVFDIRIRNYFDNGVYISSGLNCQISGVSTVDGDSHINISSGVKVRGSSHIVSSCEIRNCIAGIHVSGTGDVADSFGANGHGTVVHGNIVENAQRDGVIFSKQNDYAIRHAKVTGNTLINTASGGGGFAAIRGVADYTEISGNVIQECASDTAAIILSWADPPSGAGAPTRGTGITISSNTITGCDSEGIRIQNIDDSVISGNKGHDLCRVVGAGHTDLVDARSVTTSELYANVAMSGAVLALRLDGSCENCRIRDNWSDNGADRNLIIGGTGHNVEMVSPQTPEGAIPAAPGSRYWRADNGTGFIKQSGVGDTGWVELDTGTALPIGTTSDSTLHWNSTSGQWVENTNVIATSAGAVTLGSTLDVAGGAAFGGATRVGANGLAVQGTWALITDSETDSITKAGRIGVRPWNMAQDPVILCLATALETVNTVNFGGGYGAGQAATRVSFWGAASVGTATGTEHWRIAGSNGKLSSPSNADLETGGALTANGLTYPSNASGNEGDILTKTGAGTIGFESLADLGLPETGSTNNATLRWDTGVNQWVENTSVRISATGGTVIEGGLTLESPSPSFRVGDGTGGPIQLFAKATANDAWMADVRVDGTAASDRVWVFRVQANTQNYEVLRRSLVDGSAVDTPFSINHDDGDVNVKNHLRVTSGADGDGSLTMEGTLIASGLTYPTSDGTDGQVLTTDGNGTLTFSSVSGTITDGTTTNSTLRWDGANWVESANFLVTDSGNVTVSGASIRLTVGDGTGVPGLATNRDSSGALQDFLVLQVEGVDRWRHRTAGTSFNWILNRRNADGSDAGDALTVASSSGDITTGAALSVTANLVVSGSSIFFNHGAPSVTVGSGGTSSTIRLRSGSSAAGEIRWDRDSAVSDWIMRNSSGAYATRDLFIQRRDDDGNAKDQPFTLRRSDGALVLANNLVLNGTGVDGDGDLTMEGTLIASGLTYPTSDGTNGQVLTTDGNGTLTFSSVSGTVPDGGTENSILTWSGTAWTENNQFLVGGAGSVLCTSVDIGTPGTPPTGTFLNIHGPSTSNAITIWSSENGISRVWFANASGANNAGSVAYDNFNDRIIFSANQNELVYLEEDTTSVLRPMDASSNPVDLGADGDARWGDTYAKSLDLHSHTGFTQAFLKDVTNAGQETNVAGAGTWQEIEVLHSFPSNGAMAHMILSLSARNPGSTAAGYISYDFRVTAFRTTGGTVAVLIHRNEKIDDSSTWAGFINFRITNDGNNVVLQVQNTDTGGTPERDIRWAYWLRKQPHGLQAS